MTILNSTTPAYICLVSLAAVVPILLSSKRPNLREFWTFLAAFATLGLVLSMLPSVLDGKEIHFTIWELLPNLPLVFRVDALGMLFALVASSLWIATSMYSIGYMRGLNEHAQTRFFTFFATSISATMGVAFAGNLLTLYVFYELLSMSTYPLVTHHQDKDARGGGRTYLSYLLGTSVAFLLPAMIYSWLKSGGDMDFQSGGFLADAISAETAPWLLLFMVFGFAKGGLMPFHSWLPGAMVAPTPVSALLHAVAVVKVGVFCIIRVITGVFGIDFLKALDLGLVIAWIAAFTVITSSLIAMSQDNLKRRLAFSTIGQLSYIILGISLLGPLGIQGSTLHIAAHALGKITLFFCAGAIFVASGKKYISELDGIGRSMPITMSCFCIGALSVTGLPPTLGFLSKWHLLMGTIEIGQIALLSVFLLSTLLNAYYLFQPVYRAFFVPEKEASKFSSFKEAPFMCVFPIMITAMLCIFFFIYPNTWIELTQRITLQLQ